RQLAFTGAVQLRVVVSDPPFASDFGVIHGNIGTAKQFGTAALNQGAVGNTNTRANMNGATAQPYGGAKEVQHSVGKRGGERLRMVATDGHSKFIAAQARQHSPRWNTLTQRLRYRHDQIVPHAMTVDIVHILKAIKIRSEERRVGKEWRSERAAEH